MSLSKLLERSDHPGFLEGHFLIAMPSMPDPRFKRAVVYLCAHSRSGAMGLVINQPASDVQFPDLLVELKIVPQGSNIILPPGKEKVPVVRGGPVEQSRGLVLHSPDVMIENATLAIQDGVCLTATLEILKSLATGKGPREAFLALGYAAWGPGQLEGEIQSSGWLTCPANAELIFDPDFDGKYLRVMRHLGIDPDRLSSDVGHA